MSFESCHRSRRCGSPPPISQQLARPRLPYGGCLPPITEGYIRSPPGNQGLRARRPQDLVGLSIYRNSIGGLCEFNLYGLSYVLVFRAWRDLIHKVCEWCE